MKDIAAIKQPVIHDFERFEELFKSAFQSDNQQLTEIYSYLLTNVGKQIRPTLTLLCSKLCGSINDMGLQASRRPRANAHGQPPARRCGG